jgi:carboxyl-terminal processing protease
MTVLDRKSKLIIGGTILAVATITFTSIFCRSQRTIAFDRQTPQSQVSEVWQLVARNYVDGSFNQNDWRKVGDRYLSRNYSDREQGYRAIKEMLETLNDPYTRFMNPDEFREFNSERAGQRVGVGIQLGTDETTKQIVIIAPVEGTPAARAGIISQDVIIKIDGKSTAGIGVNAAVKMIRGKAGTDVTLTIQRGDKTIDYRLTRQQIEVRPVEAKYRPAEGDIGYIRLKQFSDRAAGEMRAELQNLKRQGAKGYIIDLRSNPGGLYYGAIDVARMFMNDGTIVATKSRRDGGRTQIANRTAIVPIEPVVLLIDGGSASASEIVAGAFRDNKRGKLVGAKTFGKGLVQSVLPISGNAGMTVTVARYYTPNGTDIHKKGIEPDVEVKITKEQIEALRKNPDRIGTSQDLQYLKARELLQSQLTARTR